MASEFKIGTFSVNIESKDEGDELVKWMSDLYNLDLASDDELKAWYLNYQYQGFNRAEVLADFRRKVKDPKIAIQVILVCALRGPQRAAETQLMNGTKIREMGIPASGLKGKRGVSCQRITAATADLAAFYLRKLNVPKRLNLTCPAWLQFPSAGSLPLSPEMRLHHREFSIRFSILIGGEFNEQIYEQMAANCYCSPNVANALNTEMSVISVTVPFPATYGQSSSSSSSSAHNPPSATPVVPPGKMASNASKLKP